ncbi:GIY-YIG nuclease family protein [Sinorhizobium meliloti]|uniref:GIY-YIG nuclease family protein n=1 Tax=Rhizobium meliloti TaxID=382 RepID=UPI0001E4EB17|nr:GIY-YIG nuclease family protein [Sinorhizobium meliloti]AEG09266.1 Excinuclease ABC C subunit domain protein [Sinorhizobium meliloti BL225C]MDE4548751.1 GIY-YIG nuclease family protein [Sinorhizobium meliloti]MDE4570549.1 GIY-YIG nuclease family protein [Sinorhizobium meliloti]SDZ02268.1 group I intron endonuclease [Sinorhizobium meliloti]
MELKIEAVSGIYEIRHLASNTAYVGRTVNLMKRRCQHYSALAYGRHSNKSMQRDYDASREGKSAFLFSVLEYGEPDHLAELEQAYISSGNYRYNRSNDALSGCGVGEGHHRYSGTFKTPWGEFPSSYQAAEASEGMMSQASVWTSCTKPEKVISGNAYGHSKYLQTHYDRSIVGKMTWRDIGFSFQPNNQTN